LAARSEHRTRRLTDLHTAWDKPDEAAMWREKLEANGKVEFEKSWRISGWPQVF